MFNEDIIFLILRYVQDREASIREENEKHRPIQKPFSRWAIDEIISRLKMETYMYPDEVIRQFISLLETYKNAAEPERKNLFNIAITTSRDLYFYLFEENHIDEKESVPF